MSEKKKEGAIRPSGLSAGQTVELIRGGSAGPYHPGAQVESKHRVPKDGRLVIDGLEPGSRWFVRLEDGTIRTMVAKVGEQPEPEPALPVRRDRRANVVGARDSATGVVPSLTLTEEQGNEVKVAEYSSERSAEGGPPGGSARPARDPEEGPTHMAAVPRSPAGEAPAHGRERVEGSTREAEPSRSGKRTAATKKKRSGGPDQSTVSDGQRTVASGGSKK